MKRCLTVKLMNYKKFASDVKTGQIKSPCLIYGKEEYLVKWAVESLRGMFIKKESGEFDLTVINGTDADADYIINSCETLPVFSKKRVVLLDNFFLLEGSRHKITESDEKMLSEYFESVPDTCILIITCGEKVDKRKKIVKTVFEHGSVYEFSKLDASDLKKWIIKRFKSAGKDVEAAAVSRLVEESGYHDNNSEYGLYNLENDINKILFYAAEKNSIGVSDIESNVSGNIDRNIFAAIEFLSKGKKGEALKMIGDMLMYGENEYGIIAMIYRQFENILCVRQMKENMVSFENMKKQLGIPEFAVSKLLRMSEIYSEEKLKGILMKVFDADKSIKTGKLDPKLALEMLIANI